jgi:hypothetical protein
MLLQCVKQKSRVLVIGLFILLVISLRLSAQSCLTSNIAAGKPVVALPELSYASGSLITDGNLSTTWAGDVDGTYWAYVDLGQSFSLCKVVVKWYYGSGYTTFKIQGSNTANNDWIDLATASNPESNQALSMDVHDIDLSSVTTPYRYVRMYIPFYSAWGPKVRELEIYSKADVAPPEVSITSPADGANFNQGTDISINATASVQGSTISKVEFFEGPNKLGEDLTAPYQYIWNNEEAGDYSIVAKAYSSTGQLTVSSPVTITVAVPSSGWSLTGNVGIATNSFLGTTDGKPLVFKTNGIESFRITPTGQVSIGTTDPKTYKLAVNGDAIFTRIKVKQYSTWPDYVFNINYRLPSLNDVESFIRKYQCLPGVPSAKEVERNGLDVGDSQAILLKKIEELTLYIIDINKQMIDVSKTLEKLKEENKALKKQLNPAN